MPIILLLSFLVSAATSPLYPFVCQYLCMDYKPGNPHQQGACSPTLLLDISVSGPREVLIHERIEW